MFLRAGLVSLALLLASRLLGLLRESVQAAALGAGAAADVAILMLTLPDLLTGILASGALAYVLLPLWARQTAAAQEASQRRVARALLAAGAIGALILLLAPWLAARALAPGLSGSEQALAHQALRWSALCLPLALLAALWTTRLQHQRDFTGMYGANLVVNSAVIVALLLAAGSPHAWLWTLGSGLLLAMLARLLWLRLRLVRGEPPAQPAQATEDSALPAPTVWLWALASAGLPLLLPLLARSLASSQGEGALTSFNYAWKLVELPLVPAPTPRAATRCARPSCWPGCWPAPPPRPWPAWPPRWPNSCMAGAACRPKRWRRSPAGHASAPGRCCRRPCWRCCSPCWPAPGGCARRWPPTPWP